MALQQYNCGKGFIFSAMASVAITLLLAGALLLAEQAVQVTDYPNAAILGSAFYSLEEGVFKHVGISVQRNGTSYFISERVWPNKDASIQSKMTSYAVFMQNFSKRITSNASLMQPASYSNMTLSGKNLNYSWNYAIRQLRLQGDFSLVRIVLANSATSITDNCTNGSSKTLAITAGLTRTYTPVGACQVTLNFSSQLVPIIYDGYNFTISYANLAENVSQNITLNVSSTGPLRFLGTTYTGNTSSTTNPGWTEPAYPAGANAVKHYGSMTAKSNSYRLIVIDADNNAQYDSLYLDADNDGNFTQEGIDLFLLQNQSHIFLNNSIFLVTIPASGVQVQLEDLFGARMKKSSDELISEWTTAR